jgi:hypothetical protein
MELRWRARMVLHGAVVIVIGLLAGFPHALVLTGAMAGEERAWRMAHLEGVLNGLLVLAVAAAGDALALSARGQAVLALSLIAMAYANVLASILGASAGVRGLSPGGPAANSVVYLLFLLAIVGVLLGLGCVVAGARRRLSGRP